MTKPASRTSATRPTPATPLASPPATLRLAAAAHLLQAVGMLVATGFSAAATISGKSYETSSGIALTVLAFIGVLALAAVAYGIAKARPWSRTPAVMCQFFVILAGVLLVDGHRYYWGVPTLILAAAALAALFAPPSLKALNRT
jgi:hypothetical protein